MGGINQLFSYSPIKNTKLSYDESLFDPHELEQFKNTTPQHLTLTQLKKILPKEIVDSYFKFTVIRNPYHRIVSEYAYVHETPTDKTKDFRDISFEEFLDKAFSLSEDEGVRLFDGHLKLQMSYVIDEDHKIGVDQVYKMEKLKECTDKLKTLTGLDISLPHARTTTFVSNKECLTHDNKVKIYDYYKEDFLFFDYRK